MNFGERKFKKEMLDGLNIRNYPLRFYELFYGLYGNCFYNIEEIGMNKEDTRICPHNGRHCGRFFRRMAVSSIHFKCLNTGLNSPNDLLNCSSICLLHAPKRFGSRIF